MIWWIAGASNALLIAALAGNRLAANRRARSWAGDRYRRVRSRVSADYPRVRRWLRGLSLLPAVSIAVAGGVAIAVVATWILRNFIQTSSKAADPIDITKLSFTVAGGVGAVVALVVAYRRQRDVEQGRFVERFGAAAAQLGDHDVAVRIAGVYAMAGVADESTGLRRQQCIDVLCGYLRLPYSPELGSNHQSKLVLTEPLTGDDGSLLGQQERHLEYRQNDKEVRATILRVIIDHLRSHEYPWSACDFDFRSALFEDDVDFGQAVFGGTTQFNNATFAGKARFTRAIFSRVEFDGASFCGLAELTDVKFSGYTSFKEATFSDDARFHIAAFSRTGLFDKATFYRRAQFDFASFSHGAEFSRVTFTGHVRFNRTKFAGVTSFVTATFSDGATFGKTKFPDGAMFDDSSFSGRVVFPETDFGSERISFNDPRKWGPPAPTFDWDDDLSKKPANVTPEDWPPTPVPERTG